MRGVETQSAGDQSCSLISRAPVAQDISQIGEIGLSRDVTGTYEILFHALRPIYAVEVGIGNSLTDGGPIHGRKGVYRAQSVKSNTSR